MTLIKSISGIRGTIGGNVGDNLTPIDIAKFALAYGTMVLQRGGKKIVIGRDARLSGEMVQHILIGNLVSIGIDIIDIGMATTPTTEMAVTYYGADAGIIITASHNPKQWNAMKLLNEKGEFISAEDGKKMLQLAQHGHFDFVDVDNLGSIEYQGTEAFDYHLKSILALPYVDVESVKSKNFKVVVDAVNSIGGIAVPALLKAMGVKDIIEVNCEPTGRFQHNPEPLPENLSVLCSEVKRNNAHLGIAIDPDVDRVCFIDEKGQPIGEEYTLVCVADYVLQHKKGNTVSNLSSTKALSDITEKHGQSYAAAAVGEVNVVEVMRATNAIIGGEGNGGVILPELHYGRDALVGVAIFMSQLANSNKTVSTLRSQYPNYVISKNKITLEEGMDIDNIFDAIKKKYAKQPINDIDGLKIHFDGDWAHLRRSNTEPIIRIYSESNTEKTAQNIAQKIISDIYMLIKESSVTE